ncbi:ABC transporter substrate-binding protein [Bosea sp. (in: a-proteobacteria)]|uniref:ABC transporter substrate-binding protein n=1 Tax=Bosea sp. (in: a-proteobacteria) TaxID=1871050 RepID=UPI00260C5A3B|nr:ABC transporter substrate-binding protein [Bosea sp. (in: a-proteobacteria)]MCO5091651.1 ABC transporter substrate-binding protein [Bosea sp. (in: a-proteobacteria)]
MRIGIVTAVALSLLQMQAGGVAAQESKATTARVAIASTIDTLDPAKITANLSGAVLRTVFEQLVKRNADGSFEGLLATSWSVDESKTVWTFNLRRDVRFHDGEPFNAAAVERTFARVLDPNAVIPLRQNLGPIKAVKAVDPFTVTIETKAPFNGLLGGLTHQVASIVSPRTLEQWGSELGRHPGAGTGPFKIASFRLPDELKLERFDGYWGPKARVGAMEILARADAQTRLASLLSDEVDLDFYVSPEGQGRVKASDGHDVAMIEGDRFFMVALPMAHPAFQDIRVRKALNHAIDREQIVKSVYLGAATVVDAAITPGMFGYAPGSAYTYDPALAKKLLEEAGWKLNAAGVLEKDGQPFPTLRLLASRGRYQKDSQLAEVVLAYLKRIGVPATLQLEEFAVFFPAAQEASKTGTGLVQMAWSSPTGDGGWMICGVYAPGNSFNFGKYDNPEMAKYCKDIQNEFDVTKRKALIAEAVGKIYADVPAIYMVIPNYIVGYKKGLSGVEYSPAEYHSLNNIEKK